MGAFDEIHDDDVGDKLSKKVAGQLGEFLGFDMDPKMEKLIRIGVSRYLPTARRFAEDIAAQATSKALGKFGYSNDIAHAATIASKIVGYGIAAFPQITSVFNTGKTWWQERGDLKAKIDILPKEAFKNNFVIQEAKGRIRSNVRSLLYNNATGFVDALPQFYIKYLDDEMNSAYAPFKPLEDAAFQKYQAEHKRISRREETDFREKFFDTNKVAFAADASLTRATTNYSLTEKDCLGKRDTIEEYGTVITPIFTAVIQKLIGKNSEQKLPKADATLLIDTINQIAEDITRKPDGERVCVDGKHCSLETAITKLFSDMVKRRYGKNVELMPKRLSEVSEIIASSIKHGDLNPKALVEIMGGTSIILNREGDIADDAALNSALESMIERYSKEKALTVGTYTKDIGVTEKELSDLAFVLEDDEVALGILASHLPISVSMKITGKNRQEIRELQDRTETKFNNAVAATLQEISKMPEEEVLELGFSRSDLTKLQKASQKIEQFGDKAFAKLLGTEKQPGIETLLVKYAAKSGNAPWVTKVNPKQEHHTQNSSKVSQPMHSMSIQDYMMNANTQSPVHAR